MSGGYFDHSERNFLDVAEQIIEYVEDNQISGLDERFSPEVLERLREAVQVMKMAAIYHKHVDYLFSGDYGEESFLFHLKRALVQYSQEEKKNFARSSWQSRYLEYVPMIMNEKDLDENS